MAILDPLRYDTASDVMMRLHGTVVRYKNEPVMVSTNPTSNEDLTVTLRPLKNKTNAKNITGIHSSDEELDVSSPPLGYMNGNLQTFYIQRAPKRKQYQGFHPNEAMIFYENAAPIDINPITLISKEPMACTILNEYPRGLDVLEMLLANKQVVSKAFHRKYALSKDEVGIIKLKHITRTIGWLRPKSNICIIPDTLTNEIFSRDLISNGFEIQS